VERLEEIASNPVTIQLGQRLDFQASELAQIQDRLDRLLFQNQQLQAQLERHIQQTSQRIAQLEAQVQLSQTANESSAQTINQTGISGTAIPDLAVDDAPMIDNSSTQSPSVELTFVPDAGGDINERELLIIDSPPVNAQSVYDAAFQLLGAGEYKQAEQAFEAFVVDYPNEPLTADAYYWLGEARLIQQDFGQAFEAFQIIIDQFEEHARFENALLRGADSLVGFNDIDQAVGLYQRLIELFPNGRAAQSAQERLNRLRALN
jgi:tol-pal system protein YbgF